MLTCFFMYLSHYAFYIILLLQTSDVAHATRLWPIPMPHSLPLELAAAVAGDSLVAMESAPPLGPNRRLSRVHSGEPAQRSRTSPYTVFVFFVLP
jgi:hypothetical protein